MILKCSKSIAFGDTQFGVYTTSSCFEGFSFTFIFSVSHFISLLDICLSRDCFNNHHKQLLYSWKQKLNSIWMTSGYERRVGGSRNRSRMGPLQRSSSGGAYMDFPISHWSSHGESRDYSRGEQHTAEEEVGLSQRKRLSLQNVSKEDR